MRLTSARLPSLARTLPCGLPVLDQIAWWDLAGEIPYTGKLLGGNGGSPTAVRSTVRGVLVGFLTKSGEWLRAKHCSADQST